MPARRAITTSERRALRQHAHHNPRLRQHQLADWFEKEYQHRITQSTISESLKPKFAALDYEDTASQPLQHLDQRRLRTQKWPELETALYQWHQLAEIDVPISDALLKAKAARFWPQIYPTMEVPQFSNGWLQGFKNRYNIRHRIRHGEAASVDEAAIAEQLLAVQSLVRNYHPSDVYNCDETGLFWKATPDRGLAT